MRAMKIYLMRHAAAVSAGEWRKPDPDRPLSKMGVALLESGVKQMKRAGFSVSKIVTSPYLRALETARITAEILGAPAPTVKAELSSGTNHNVMLKLAKELSAGENVLMVGHMPEIAIFGTRLTNEPRIMDVGFEPADIVAIEVEKWKDDFGDGELLWWRKLEDWKSVTSA